MTVRLRAWSCISTAGCAGGDGVVGFPRACTHVGGLPLRPNRPDVSGPQPLPLPTATFLLQSGLTVLTDLGASTSPVRRFPLPLPRRFRSRPAEAAKLAVCRLARRSAKEVAESQPGRRVTTKPAMFPPWSRRPRSPPGHANRPTNVPHQGEAAAAPARTRTADRRRPGASTHVRPRCARGRVAFGHVAFGHAKRAGGWSAGSAGREDEDEGASRTRRGEGKAEAEAEADGEE
ncbi:hypothetical protein JHW43_007805 [Diplocarpon mali]|nr:hypothetical protein JHW43_007805 [Diplocarpon mali]